MKAVLRTSLLAAGLATLLSGVAHAGPMSVDWPSRHSKIVCGGSVDNKELEMKVVVAGELIKGEVADGRALIYVDLHKPGQVRWVLNDGMSDDDYTRREAILAKLAPEDAKLLKGLSAPHQMDLQAGLNDSYVNMLISSGEKTISLSCQEVAL